METICQILIRLKSSILSKHVGLLFVVLVYKLFWTQVCFRAADPNLWYTEIPHSLRTSVKKISGGAQKPLLTIWWYAVEKRLETTDLEG
jgi:hypothetical protein